jgi:hypothetical protein
VVDRAVRIGAGAAVLGALLALVGNLVHPRAGDDPDFEVYRRFADSTRLRVADLVLIVAMILLAAGVVAIARALDGTGGDALSQYGRLFGAVGATIAIADFGVESFAYRTQVDAFAQAGKADLHGSFWAANAVDHLDSGLFLTWTLLFLGIAPLLLGIAAMRADRWPSWIGVLGAVGGAVCVVVASIMFVQTDAASQDVAFLVGSLLVTAWFLAAGGWLWANSDRDG